MRDLSTQVQDLIATGTYRPFLLLDINIDSTHFRYTDADVPVAYQSTLFNPRGIKTDQVKYGAQTIVDSVRMEIDNIDQALNSPFVGGTPQASAVTLRLALLSTSYHIATLATPITLFQGTLDAWSLDEEKITCTLVSDMVKWNQKTLAKYSASCRWKEFKGTECGYSGSQTWCDRSYTRCSALANTVNFGGFRWLPSIIDKEIWWGRSK